MAVLTVPPDSVVHDGDDEGTTVVSVAPGSTVHLDLDAAGEQPTRRQRLAAAAGAVWRRLDAELGIFEWITAIGSAMLLVGLWVWFGAGPALAGVGALVVWMGIAGGRAAAAQLAAVNVVDEDDDGGRRGPVLAEAG